MSKIPFAKQLPRRHRGAHMLFNSASASSRGKLKPPRHHRGVRSRHHRGACLPSACRTARQIFPDPIRHSDGLELCIHACIHLCLFGGNVSQKSLHFSFASQVLCSSNNNVLFVSSFKGSIAKRCIDIIVMSLLVCCICVKPKTYLLKAKS